MQPDIDAVIRQIADEQGVTTREVFTEMQAVIDIGYESQDEGAQAAWASLPFAGKPTPRELIVYLAGKLTNENLH